MENKKGLNVEVSNTVILEAVVSLGEQVRAIQEHLATKVATKDFVEMTVEKMVEKAKEELLAEIRPIGRAVDKDAVAIIDHERRIGRLEKQLV